MFSLSARNIDTETRRRNTCSSPNLNPNGFLQSVSAAVWRNQKPDESLKSTQDDSSRKKNVNGGDLLRLGSSSTGTEEGGAHETHGERRVTNRLSAREKNRESQGNLWRGRKLGQGQFGTTFLSVDKKSGQELACKTIPEDVKDVRREIQIMHHLSGHPNVIQIVGVYEDAVAVHVVMEICAGGELFDRNIQRGHYTERKAAELARTIVGVIEACHSLGVMYCDLKPDNFLFVNGDEEAALKTIDFGLSVFFKPDLCLMPNTSFIGSPYYVAPEVLKKHYSHECDVWSAGVIIYILLSGVPPFWDEPWPSVSENAKDLVRWMLIRDPKKRMTAHEVIWVRVDGVALDKPLYSAVLTRLTQFSAMNKLKKIAIKVIAESLSEEEIAGLKEMFKMIDTDNSGHITLEELKKVLDRVGANLKDSEILGLMQAADIDNSGTIDFGEFIAAMVHLNKIEKEDHMFIAFSYFDKDGSGYTTRDELQQACKQFGLADDGRIDYSEFVDMMQDTGFGKMGLMVS
ncbi:hypothetical protein Bca52824_029064 [Brassica carinata]|uniref:non-specific serine/threonine protein kinase n=1 Tax=Brassica carinata TaxID=52824 RepID=A0A8X7VDF8_BRACI|nr:hypothetical protein Bca52824_029064 [Brassica carinata]